MLKIGPHAIKNRVFLAPMAGITDLPFRELCMQYGAGLATSEMVTSDSRLWHTHKSRSRFEQSERSGIKSIQIAGSEPAMLAEAAKFCQEAGAQIIDINMGCPVKKVCKKLAGSALLQDESKVESILQAVVQAVDVPVTLKTRIGWSQENKNGVNVARIAEQAGISALAVHGRTRECKFNGSAQFDTIAHIVDAVGIPVIANGDITTVADAHAVLKQTHAAAVMVGRGAWGNPWLIQSIANALNSENGLTNHPQKPHWAEIKHVILCHLSAIHAFYGGIQGVRIARKHINWYAQTLASLGACAFNMRQFNQLETQQRQIEALETYFEGPNTYEDHAA